MIPISKTDQKFGDLLSMLDTLSYTEFLEVLKIEFGDFLRLSESGKTIRYSSLRARQQSMKLKFLLKIFRVKSIGNDKKITTICNEMKLQIKKETEY